VRPNTLVKRRSLSSPRDPRLLERLETFRRAVTMMFTDLKESTEYFENFGDIAGLAWFMNVTMRCGRRLKSVEVAL
jgi:class 3 adenylate cyclase